MTWPFSRKASKLERRILHHCYRLNATPTTMRFATTPAKRPEFLSLVLEHWTGDWWEVVETIPGRFYPEEVKRVSEELGLGIHVLDIEGL